jgi:hypothetical protein
LVRARNVINQDVIAILPIVAAESLVRHQMQQGVSGNRRWPLFFSSPRSARTACTGRGQNAAGMTFSPFFRASRTSLLKAVAA